MKSEKQVRKDFYYVTKFMIDEDDFGDSGNKQPKSIYDLRSIDWEMSPIEMSAYHLGKFDALRDVLEEE